MMTSPFNPAILSGFLPDHDSNRAVYLQLTDFILTLITNGTLRSGQKLPSTRSASAALGLNRLTVGRAYEELQIQGWLSSAVGKGTFVSVDVPSAIPLPLTEHALGSAIKTAGFSFVAKSFPNKVTPAGQYRLHLDDGYPDPRLAPLQEFYRAYRNELTRSGLYSKFGSYGDPAGPERYREALATYLHETRGLRAGVSNIMSIRGTLMGINLVCNSLIEPGDVIVSGIPGWSRAAHNFLQAGAKHIGIGVDEHGLLVDELEAICRREKVRMVYVTPHHHYPTTVSLRIDRRLKLLHLANTYGFIIFEDDYDFDFHYRGRPLLPLASADEQGMVIYCGSFSKSFSPAFRMGYLVAAENVIAHLSRTRILLDRQGDHILDNAMATLLQDGTIARYIRRTLPIYEERRNHFAQRLASTLNDYVTFAVPAGGMSMWTRFDKAIDTVALAESALKRGLYIENGLSYRYANFNQNGIRLGFASCSKDELDECVAILKHILEG